MIKEKKGVVNAAVDHYANIIDNDQHVKSVGVDQYANIIIEDQHVKSEADSAFELFANTGKR